MDSREASDKVKLKQDTIRNQNNRRQQSLLNDPNRQATLIDNNTARLIGGDLVEVDQICNGALKVGSSVCMKDGKLIDGRASVRPKAVTPKVALAYGKVKILYRVGNDLYVGGFNPNPGIRDIKVFTLTGTLVSAFITNLGSNKYTVSVVEIVSGSTVHTTVGFLISAVTIPNANLNIHYGYGFYKAYLTSSTVVDYTCGVGQIGGGTTRTNTVNYLYGNNTYQSTETYVYDAPCRTSNTGSVTHSTSGSIRIFPGTELAYSGSTTINVATGTATSTTGSIYGVFRVDLANNTAIGYKGTLTGGTSSNSIGVGGGKFALFYLDGNDIQIEESTATYDVSGSYYWDAFQRSLYRTQLLDGGNLDVRNTQAAITEYSSASNFDTSEITTQLYKLNIQGTKTLLGVSYHP